MPERPVRYSCSQIEKFTHAHLSIEILHTRVLSKHAVKSPMNYDGVIGITLCIHNAPSPAFQAVIVRTYDAVL
jgi:hypothetical protein